MNDKIFFIFKENLAITHGLNALAQRVAELEKQTSKKRKGKTLRKALSTVVYGGVMFVIGAKCYQIADRYAWEELKKKHFTHDEEGLESVDDLDDEDYED